MKNNGILYIIATPIGNIKDITLRSLEVLKEVDEVYCEDTRQTKKILDFYEIKKLLSVNNDINEIENVEKICEKISVGKKIALLSDRGTPLISDPGFKIVRACIERGYQVESLPGPTAFVTALTLSNLAPKPFYFFGFLNSKSSKRKKELDQLKNISATLIFYESVHRLNKTLADMLEIFGDRKISIARELTKQHEEIIRGNLKEIIDQDIILKGEFVIVVDGYFEEKETDHNKVIDEIKLNIEQGLSEKEAINIVAKQNMLSKSKIYNLYQKLKKGD